MVLVLALGARLARAAGRADAAHAGADRSHRLLGVDRERGLALADADAAEGGLRERAAQPRGAPRDRGVGLRARAGGCERLQAVRRRRADARAGPPAHHMAGRPNPEAGIRRGHADAPACTSAPRRPRPRRRWQGDSAAAWEFAGGVETDRNGIPAASAAGRGARPRADAPKGGSLRVTTTNVLPGFLRKNGVPYSDKARIEEYFDRMTYPERRHRAAGAHASWTTRSYLQLPFITSTHFKLERDGSKWKPTPCRIDPPVVRPEP